MKVQWKKKTYNIGFKVLRRQLDYGSQVTFTSRDPVLEATFERTAEPWTA